MTSNFAEEITALRFPAIEPVKIANVPDLVVFF
jgi:hypothetical protein